MFSLGDNYLDNRRGTETDWTGPHQRRGFVPGRGDFPDDLVEMASRSWYAGRHEKQE